MNIFQFLKFLLGTLLISNVSAWDQEELEIFDLVEEINENFYLILKVEQNASASEIRKAFRALSVILHPDKNDAEDANIQFRNLVSVYEVLKDSTKRQKYDKVLRDGLPNWKSALYYYRHYRKMGLMEMCALLFIIITVCQYIVAWAAYAEKKYTAESLFGSKLRKQQKKNKTSVNIDELINLIPTPSIFNTLPFQIVYGVWNGPRSIKNAFTQYFAYREQLIEEKQREEDEAERQRLLEDEFLRQKEARKEGVRKRKPAFAAKEKTDEELKGYSQLNLKQIQGSGVKAVESKEAILNGGFWTDEDLAELTRLVKKYPNGTLSRWELIANQMNRSVQEVTFMAARIKDSIYRPTDSIADTIVQEATKKTKKISIKIETVDDKSANNESFWTQEQQKLLETAIVKYPKSGVDDRWQKIANTIPGKTKDECLARYKYLVQKVQKLKAEAAQRNKEEADKVAIEENDIVESTNKIENIEDESNIKSALDDDDNQVTAKMVEKKSGGKPRNKRKERKKRMEFSSDEEYNQNDEI